MPLDILEFFFLTPLPGSEDHKVLWGKGVDMDADLNKYDLEHVVTDHPKMTREELEAIYQEAWSLYYTPEHIETLLRRAVVTNIPLLSFMKVLVQFTTMMQVEKVHPLQSGLFRLKHIARTPPRIAARNPRSRSIRASSATLIANNLKLVATIWWMLSSSAASSAIPTGIATPTRRSRRCGTTTRRRSISSPRPTARGPPSRTREKIDELTHAAAGDRSGFAGGRLSSPAWDDSHGIRAA